MLTKKKRNGSSYPINNLYFAFFFILLFCLTLHHAFLIHELSQSSRLYFIFYAFLQESLEFLFLITLASFLKKRMYPKIYSLFIGLTFIWFLARLINYGATRVINISLWAALDAFVFNEKLDNFLELLRQSGITLKVWLLLASALFAIPWLGFFLYWSSERVSHTFFKVRGRLATYWILLPIAIVAWDVAHIGLINSIDYQRYQNVLPWGRTLLHPKKPLLELLPNKTFMTTHDVGPFNFAASEDRPNLLLIVAESLRDDLITEDTAPHLSRFKQENISFDLSLANANATHLSWFSIFTSKFPCFWGDEKENRTGAMPLQLLKKMGYQIRLYSSAELKYYGIDELIFGEDHSLLNAYFSFPHNEDKEAWESDKGAVEALIADLKNPALHKGQLFILFLDSTHFNYSWPPDFKPLYTDYAKEMNILAACGLYKNVELIKNRYKNALAYIDTLFAKVRTGLEEAGLYDEMWLTFTGDHGEEFFEHGHLFHASQLCKEQLNVPLYMKIKGQEKQVLPIASHVDIFPTIIEQLTGEKLRVKSGGASIFDAQRSPVVFSSQNAWSHIPSEFMLHDGQLSLKGKLISERKKFRIDKIKISEIQDIQGKSLHFGSEEEQVEAAKILFERSLRKTFFSHE